MSRVEYDEEGETPPEFWERRVHAILSGKRGRAILQELRTALRELPEARLVANELAAEGNVCLVGAWLLYKRTQGGLERDQALKELEAIDGTETIEEGRRAGLAFTLAWHLQYLNDDEWSGLSPEGRYTMAIAWVEQTLALPPLEHDRLLALQRIRERAATAPPEFSSIGSDDPNVHPLQRAWEL